MDTPAISDIIAFLTGADPDVLEQMGEAAVLEAFRSAAAEVPAYQDMLAKRGVDPATVTDVAVFRASAPLLDKGIFSAYRVDQLCRHGSLKPVKAVIPSSGHSGVFAFNVETYENVNGGTTLADLTLEYCFRVSEKKTFLVNTYPMGLQIPTALPSTNTGVNADVALAIIKTFAPHFEQVVIVSQPAFAKKLVEDGIDQGIDWAHLGTSLVTGGEGFVESWRTYMSGLLGIPDPDRPSGRVVGSTMGVGELAVNLFHETPDTMAIIRRAYRDRKFRTALLGVDTDQCPHLFVYYPMRTFLESLPLEGAAGGELAVSMSGLDNHMPFLRYRTGDVVRIVSYRTLERVIAEHAPDLTPPELKLPVVAVFGRSYALHIGGRRISAEQVKEAVFADPVMAGATTGFFRATDSGGQIAVDVQLRAGRQAASDLTDRLAGALSTALPGVPLGRLRLFAFKDFPHEVTYERKYAYIPR